MFTEKLVIEKGEKVGTFDSALHSVRSEFLVEMQGVDLRELKLDPEAGQLGLNGIRDDFRLKRDMDFHTVISGVRKD